MQMQRKHIEGTIANGNGCSRTCSRTPKSRIAQRPLKAALVLLLAFALSFMLMGCRDTDVLTQKTIDAPGVSEIDYSLRPVSLEQPDEEQVPKGQTEGEVDDQNRDESENTPDYQKDNPDTPQEQTSQQNYDSAESQSSGNASNGGEADDNEGEATQSSTNSANRGGADKEGDGSSNGAGDDQDQQEEPPRGRTVEVAVPDMSDDTQQEDNSSQPEQGTNSGQDNDNTWNNNPSGNGGGTSDDNKSGSTYADGTYVTLPSGKIAASGPYATIVQSLGGQGALAAAPQQWIDSLPAGAYDNKQELVDVRGISSWGDGAVMTDAALQEIIASDAEVVLTSNTYNVMNQAQADALNAKGIDVLVVPDIGTNNAMDEDIALCVDVVGEILKDEGASIQFDSKNAATQWRRMHDVALETCYRENGGLSCARLLGSYVANYVYQGPRFTAEQYKIDPSPVAIITEYVDVWDEGFIWQGVLGVGLGNHVNYDVLPDEHASSFDLIDYYFQHSGLTRQSIALVGRGLNVERVEDDRLIADGTVEDWSPDGFHEDYPSNPDGLPTPVLIARSLDVAQSIAQQAGSLKESPYNQGDDYGIWIMPGGPDGMSWDDGTFESFLVAPWTYSMSRNYGTDESDSFVNDFYTTFYRPGDGGVAALIDGYGTVVNVTCAK